MAGIPTSIEIDTKDLPSTLVTKVKKIMENSKSPSLSLRATPRGAADHFSYRISFRDGGNDRIIECSQYDLRDDLKLLVKYLENVQRND